ncbi:fungal fucose-specific lectin-domain-containing protein [Phanerochaete sordida]|uniref:Fungal fucose-specific lectin-domain-containing protein n=1 Tax=Phanerochaete sordida TaxID=48140 RepID=A0A9P3LJJ2_9APHY|nr:fungal fucose-specific lectin-domain-containing protein [Phanerochaete sordida]
MSDDQEGVFTWDASAIDEVRDVAFGRVVVPVPLLHKPLKKNKYGFEYAEHSFIGDAISLTLAGGQRVPAVDYQFVLTNGLRVTYGQINGLASDFYGTDKPISDGRDPQDCKARFDAAFRTLSDPSPRQPGEARSILAILQTEVDAVNVALQKGEDPSVAYSQLPDVSVSLQALTIGRPSGFPSYLGLARINWDHFGDDARRAYNSGHAAALQAAASGNLDLAYTMNAFADHFLEDSFSAGHMRTPRRYLHRDMDIFADACAKFMHDEDNAIGLKVNDPMGEQWTAYGDKRALDKVAADNLKRCVSAVQLSANEVYDAYKSGKVIPAEEYRAWTKAPTLASAQSATQVLAPLFTAAGQRRKDIKNRRSWEFTSDWWFWTTVSLCKASGRWNYPITIDGLGMRSVVPDTRIAVTFPRLWKAHVYYQEFQSQVLESVHIDGTWSGGIDYPVIPDARTFTPLAVVSWEEGAEIRVYYINSQQKLSEYCYSSKSNRWFSGELNDSNITLSGTSSIAAVAYGQRAQIRVYVQEPNSGVIQEYIHDNNWHRGEALASAHAGTSIAAVVWDEGSHVRVYYQATDRSLREQCMDNGRWAQGQFAPGTPAAGTALSAVAIRDGTSLELQVYWMNAQHEIVQARTGPRAWLEPSKIVGPLNPGTRFAAANWAPRHTRLYYQSSDQSIQELCNDGSGWFGGAAALGAA